MALGPLRHQIKAALARRIVSGHYQGGERLVELRIAEQFGTSQVPVREALRDLDVTGLVESVPRRGTFVSSEILASVRDIFFCFSNSIDLMKVATCHQPIVDAIAAQNPELAATLSREHQDESEAKVSL